MLPKCWNYRQAPTRTNHIPFNQAEQWWGKNAISCFDMMLQTDGCFCTLFSLQENHLGTGANMIEVHMHVQKYHSKLPHIVQ
jgi:hypothetical protein